MGLILDTNALSAVADGEPTAVAAFSRATRLALPVIVLGEFRFGIAQSRHKSEYERWLGEMLSASRVLEVGEETTRHYAAIRVELKRAGTPIPSNDIWIAALSRQHALPVLSRDQHFDLIKGLRRHAW
jgi:tRNA(fMet)-specific endonuclease VapC